MRRSAWTIGAALLAALSLGVAACGGSDNDAATEHEQRRATRRRRRRQAEAGRQADGAVDRRRRLHRLRPDLLPDGLLHLQRDAEARCTRTSPTTATTPVPDLADGRPAGLRGRQDRHGQDQAGRQVLAAVSDHAVTSADVKYAIERGFFNTVGDRLHARPTSATSRARRSASSRARRSRASRRPTTTRSSSSSSARSAA